LQSPVLPLVFQWLCLVFLITRIVWACLLIKNLETATFTINRISMAIFFTALTLILFSWIQVLSAEFSVQTGFLPGLKWGFIVCNVALYLILVISFGLFLAYRKSGIDWEGNKFYEANIIVIASVNLFAVFVFLFYGLRLFLKLRSAQQFAGAAVRLTLVAFVMVACFVCRLVFFVWRPATGKFLPEPLFYTMGYFVPEIVPISVQFYLFYRRMQLTIEAKYHKLDTANVHNDSTELSSKSHQKSSQPAPVHRADVHYADGDEDMLSDVDGEEFGASNLSFYEMLREGPLVKPSSKP